ncbi:hypothetical protein G6M87_32355 (plasmid) [Rhizobium rhizogenes]|uniref:hypothetical protein n=1 Tax=Rhizobium rhizogenes TaxID=359 RepID=UPI0015716CED|nr:hypothetical protein [Rhizobium rhizogenes]NTI26908.1 hypothetical protein [Rhizobium rhizogenes]QTG10238.1 hypothetical protein G6M87_32355 [Rhizobium rhizogenes]
MALTIISQPSIGVAIANLAFASSAADSTVYFRLAPHLKVNARETGAAVFLTAMMPTLAAAIRYYCPGPDRGLTGTRIGQEQRAGEKHFGMHSRVNHSLGAILNTVLAGI